MAKLKTIGYITNELVGNYQLPLFHNLCSAVREKPCNLVIYEGRILNSVIAVEKEHNIVYNLIDAGKVDGFIIAAGAVFNSSEKAVKDEFMRRLVKRPVISFNLQSEHAVSILVDNREGMLKLISHLADDHGYSKFMFVKGPDFNDDAVMRFAIFCEEMEKRGIAVDPSWILEGDFRPESGFRIIKNIIESGKKPEAVIFANDDMAIAALDFLSRKCSGIRYRPAIAGFDNAFNAMITDPPLTTVEQPLREMSSLAVDVLFRRMNGESTQSEYKIGTNTVIRNSCGCTDAVFKRVPGVSLFSSALKIHENIQTYDLKELAEQLTAVLREYSIQSCFISLYAKDGPQEEKDGFTIFRDSDIIYAFENGSQVSLPETARFRSRDLLPQNFIIPEPFTLVVKPLFFRENHFGFIVFNTSTGHEMDLENIRGNVSNTLSGSLLIDRLHKTAADLRDTLGKLNQKNLRLKTESSVDELTGIYNRRGFFDACSNYLRDGEYRPFAVIYADLDDLKPINDSHGHDAGDRALCEISRIFMSSVRSSDVVARIGGDEFLLFLTGPTNDLVKNCLSRIEMNLQNFNGKRGVPYRLGCTYGFAMSDPERSSLEDVIKDADRALYISKREKKKLSD